MTDKPRDTYAGIVSRLLENPPRHFWFVFGLLLLTFWILSTTAVLHGEGVVTVGMWEHAEQETGKELAYHLTGALVSIAIQTLGLAACVHSYVTYER